MTKLARPILTLRRQAAALAPDPHPTVGEPWPSQAGHYAGRIDTAHRGSYELVVAVERPGSLLPWAKARSWTSMLRVGRYCDFRLPDRVDAARIVDLFPNLTDPPEYWLWTDETAHDFISGSQRSAWRRYRTGDESPLDKAYPGNVIAVRHVKCR